MKLYNRWTKEKLDTELEKMHDKIKVEKPLGRPRYIVLYGELQDILDRSGWLSSDFWDYVTDGKSS